MTQSQITAGSKAEARGAGGSLLLPGDLVDDRELRRIDDDRFEHGRIADELVGLVNLVETPASIALYGPWGSGKTGISNLMREKLGKDKQTKFARFDAFKYAENPLRRKFLGAVATELGIKDEKYRGDLYSNRTESDLQVPKKDLLWLTLTFLGVLLALSFVLLVLVGIGALLESGDFKKDFQSLAESVFSAGLMPAALLSAFVAVAGKSFHVDRSHSRPDSDEQFEALLADLVTASKADKVVIFVDELDRCTPEDVVATLDAIRTFLGTPRCVFVVAADQQVLERALSHRSAQATPVDSSNPYYSTGSAYLDKVFQYQISLPDLLPPNITEFAAGLIRGRSSGLWSELRSPEFVVSVLVPSHVVSPRRVKHLMNTFALSYRLAEDRHASGHLSVSPAEVAAAIAKLVCLRVEFPLFARDLTVDARLPEHVLALVDEREFDGSVDAAVRALAEEHAKPESGVARLLVGDDGDPEAGIDADEVKEAKVEHHRQLVAYLRRTKGVRGLTRDLVYLKSEESLSGLPESVSKALTAAAQDGDAQAVSRILVGGGLEDSEVDLGLALLASRLQHGLGVEAENVARTILTLAAESPDTRYARVADVVVSAVAGMLNDFATDLDSAELEGAWNLALMAEYDTREVRSDLLGRLAQGDANDALFVLRSPDRSLANAAAVNAIVAGALLGSDHSKAIDAYEQLEPITRAAALDLLGEAPAEIGKAMAAYTQVQAAKPATPAPNTPGARPVGAPTDGDEVRDPGPMIAAFKQRAIGWAVDDEVSAFAAVRFLLAIDHESSRSAALEVLGHLPPAGDAKTVTEIVRAVRRRSLGEWPKWLTSVEPGQYDEIQREEWMALARRLWQYVTSDSPASTDATLAAASALATVVEPLPIRPDLTSVVVEAVCEVVETDDGAARRVALLERIDALGRHSLVDMDAVNAALLASVLETLQREIVPADVGANLTSYVVKTISDAVRQQLEAHGVTQDVNDLVSALTGAGSWLPNGIRLVALISALGLMFVSGRKREDALPPVNEISALLAAQDVKSGETLLGWLPLAKPGAEDTKILLDQVLELGLLDDPLAKAFEEVTTTWAEDERRDNLLAYLGAPDAAAPSSQVLEAIGLFKAAPSSVADVLIHRYEVCTNNAARHDVLRLWDQSRITDGAARERLFNEVATDMVGLKTPATNPDLMRKPYGRCFPDCGLWAPHLRPRRLVSTKP